MNKYKVAAGEAADATRKAIDAGLNARKSELDLTERLTKATIELARQKRIASGEDAASINADADRNLATLADDTARRKSDAEIHAIGYGAYDRPQVKSGNKCPAPGTGAGTRTTNTGYGKSNACASERDGDAQPAVEVPRMVAG